MKKLTESKLWEIIFSNLVSILLSLPTLGGLVVAVWGILTKSLSILDVILLALLVLSLIVFISVAIWRNTSYKAYYYPRRFLRTSSNYEVIEKTVSFVRTEDDKLNYSRKMRIKCLSNRLFSILDKYIWTGPVTGAFKIVRDEGISKIKTEPRIGIWQYFEIELRNHMVKGDEGTISYHWPVISNCSEASPFFSASTDEPTRRLKLELKLGAKYKGQKVMCEEYRAIESDFSISCKEEELDENGSFTWDIPKVKRFRHYRMRWSWEAGQPAAEIDERK